MKKIVVVLMLFLSFISIGQRNWFEINKSIYYVEDTFDVYTDLKYNCKNIVRLGRPDINLTSDNENVLIKRIFLNDTIEPYYSVEIGIPRPSKVTLKFETKEGEYRRTFYLSRVPKPDLFLNNFSLMKYDTISSFCFKKDQLIRLFVKDDHSYSYRTHFIYKVDYFDVYINGEFGSRIEGIKGFRINDLQRRIKNKDMICIKNINISYGDGKYKSKVRDNIIVRFEK